MRDNSPQLHAQDVVADTASTDNIPQREDDVKTEYKNKADRQTADVQASARNAQSASADTASKDNISQDLKNVNLVELIKRYGKIPRGEKAKRGVETPKRISKTQYVSRFARTAMEADVTPDDVVSEFEKAILDGTMTHEVITDKRAMKQAVDRIKNKGFTNALDTWNALIESGHRLSKQDIALGQQLYNQCVNSKDVTNAMKIIADLVAEGTSAGQSLQAVRMLKMLSPDGKLYYLERAVEKINNEFINKLGDKYKGIKLDESLMKQFLEALTDAKRNEVYDKLCQNIADQIPSTAKDKWNAWRYLSMLGNPRTHIRNIVGNAVFYPAVRIKTYLNAALERGIKQSERTTSFKKSKESREYAAKDFKIMQKELQGVNAKYAITDDIESKRKIFKNSALEYLRRKNSDLLENEDLWFLKRYYEDAFARAMTARGISAEFLDGGTKEGLAALQQIRLIAMREAQEATYRDNNTIAEELSRWPRSQKRSVRVAGTAIEAVLPFKKTPLNIAKRGVEYSPIGLMNGVWNAMTAVKKGNITSAEAINKISKGITGTGLMMLGFFLAKLGLLSGAGDEDKKKREFDGLVGKQNYAINVGGKSYTIDWMAPVSLPLFIGVELNKATQGEEWTFAKVVDALSTISAPLLELSCLSSLSNTIESAQRNHTNPFMAIVSEIAISYITQALPTLGGQISRSVDNEKRNAYYKDKNHWLPQDLQLLIGRIATKIPFASKLLEPSIDSWGRDETYGETPERIIENFVSPGYYSEERYTAVDKELERLYNTVGGNKMFPREQQKYLTIDKVKYDLDVHQYTQAKRLRGQKSFELIDKLIQSSKYKNLSDEEKVKEIGKCYDEALDYVKENINLEK